MVSGAYDDAYWRGVDRTMVHVVNAMANYGERVVFKGGSHLRICLIENVGGYRYSEDLDFEWIGQEWEFWDKLVQALKMAERTSNHQITWQGKKVGFHWETRGSDVRGGKISVDFRFRRPDEESSLGWYPVRNLFADANLPSRDILGFTPHAVAEDKISAVLTPRRTKARDVFDLWYLNRHGYVDLHAAWEGYLGRYRREPGSVQPEQLLVELADGWAGYGEDWAAGLEKNIYPPYVRSLDTLTEMAYEFLAVLVNGHE